MRFSWLSTPHTPPASSPHPQALNQRARGRLRRVLWFFGLWCAGVAGAMLLALPFRLLMQAAMR
jgi:hypothetical protein